MVLTAGDYQAAALSPGLRRLMDHVLLTWRVCLLGVSFDEGYIATHFQENSPKEPRHLFVGAEDEVAKIGSGRGAIGEATHAIAFASFPAGEFQVLDPFARWLVSPRNASAARRAGPVAEEGVADLEDYVPVALIRAEDETQERELAWKIAFGEVDLLGEEQLIADRCLIRGAPGSGKTSLLRHLLHSHRERGEYAMLVHLAAVSIPTAARPEKILEAWSERSARSGGPEDFGADALAGRRVHVLLDGLDELPSGRRAEMAAFLVGLAGSLPQHRFVLAARPVESLEVFPEPPWAGFVLQIRDEWREEFLRRRGVTLQEVLATVPGLEGAARLLSIPFFLRTVLELREDGGLASIGDLRELSILLVRAPADADPTLPAADDLLPWMGRVALAMTIAGTTTATLEDLRRFPIDIPDALGDLDALVDQLVNRTLLMSEGGSYSFQHRLLQESLCAEELERTGPTSEVIGTVCPRASETIAGTRTEWIVPVGMVCQRSHDWRERLRDRNPLLVARNVPDSAERDERRWAAGALWSTYLATRLWMYDSHSPRPVQDSEILARLLGDPDLGDVRQEVIDALEVDQRQIRSNAIEVLGATSWDGTLRAARRILVDDEDFVVRRHAALVARDRKFTSLFEPILRRALAPEDESEADSMSAAAIDLAPKGELLRAAMTLAAPRRGHSWVVESAVRERLRPAERVRYLRALTASKEDIGRYEEREFSGLLALLGRPTAKTAEDVGWIAACWQLRGDDVLEWLGRHPSSAVGVIDAIDSEEAWLFQAAPLLARYREADLRRAGGSERTLFAARQQAEVLSRGPIDARPFEQASAAERPITLTGVLGLPRRESEWLLLERHDLLMGQVADLDDANTRFLRARLGRWWRPGEFRSAVRRTGKNSYRIAAWASGWLNYGPRLDATLRPDQWAEVAVCGFCFQEQHKWLRRRYTSRAAILAAGMVAGTGIAGWAAVLDAIPGRPPRAVIDGMLNRARRVDDAPRLDQVGVRLAQEGDRATLERLATVGSGFRRGLTPHLAAVGDLGSQELLTDRLLRHVRRGEHPGDVGWLAGVEDPGLADKLVESLAWSQIAIERLAPDVTAPLQAALTRIGGQDAVDAFDRILEADAIEGVHFLRLQRDAIAQDVLAGAGEAEGVRLARRLTLPRLSG
jgi:hypothetical protein